jgi:hypothetical protein
MVHAARKFSVHLVIEQRLSSCSDFVLGRVKRFFVG